MFNGGWSETATQSANMPDDNPKVFKLLLGWVYVGKVEVPAEAQGVVDLYIELYALAEKLNVFRLADEVMEYLHETLLVNNEIPVPNHMVKAYQLTPSGSKLRLLIAHICVFIILTYRDEATNFAWSNDKLRGAFKENEDFWSDVLNLLRQQSGKTQVDPRKRPACDYHQHASTEACPYAKT
jgi:hypothetical protein